MARLGTTLVRAADFGEWPSSAAMARLSRSLSLFSSATILPVSKVLSSSCYPYEILSPLPSLPETKGATSSHERSGFAIAASLRDRCSSSKASWEVDFPAGRSLAFRLSHLARRPTSPKF